MPERMSLGKASLSSLRAFQEAYLTMIFKGKLSCMRPGKQCRHPEQSVVFRGRFSALNALSSASWGVTLFCRVRSNLPFPKHRHFAVPLEGYILRVKHSDLAGLNVKTQWPSPRAPKAERVPPHSL